MSATTYPESAALRKRRGLPAVVLHGTQNRLWETRMNNAGVWSVVTPRRALTTDRALPDGIISPTRATLLAVGNAATWRISVDDSDPNTPTITTTATPITQGGYEGLSVFSDNGREWWVSVTAAGTITIEALGAQWTADGSPVIQDALGKPWVFRVTNGGILEVSDEALDPARAQRVILRAQDDSKAWTITVGTDGILSVTDDNVSIADTPYYDAELIAPNGSRWRLQVDANGILSVFDVEASENERPMPVVLLASYGNGLYVYDPRFRTPGQVKGGWGWERFWRKYR